MRDGGAYGCAVPRAYANLNPGLSVPITVLLYNGPLLCGFNVGIKELKQCNYQLYQVQTRTRACSLSSRLVTLRWVRVREMYGLRHILTTATQSTAARGVSLHT